MEIVSVIIPVYNVSAYLRECVESVINQSYSNLEIFLVDDGSTDSSGDICDRYAIKDNRIKVIHKKNGGLSDARNVAIDKMQGKYVTFVDSDDYLSNNAIELMMKALRETNSDMVFTIDACRFRDGENVALASSGDYSVELFDPIKMLEYLLYQKTNITGAPGKLYKSSLFLNTGIRYPYGIYFEDLATTYRLIMQSYSITMLNCRLYAYRMRDNGIIHQKFSEKKLSCISVTQKMYEDIIAQVPELKNAVASRCCSCNRMVYSQMPYNNKKQRDLVWKEICKYRSIVIKDKKSRLKEKLSCLLSYMGQSVFWFFNRLALCIKK